MRKNITEINLPKFSFTFDSPESQRINGNNKLLKYKVEQEIKTLPEDFAKYIKRSLTKHELTSELYIPKNISKNKDYDKNLLISKVQNLEIFKLENKKLLTKLASDNSSFSRVYNYIKEVEGKNNRQQKYFDEIEQIYLDKDYKIKDCMIKPEDNIFNYSILMDKTFGNNIKNDAERLVREINNKEIRRKNKLIFKFNNELLEQKLKKSTGNTKLLKKLITKNDFGIDDIKKVGKKLYRNSLFEQSYRKIRSQNILNIKKGHSLHKKDIKKEDTYLDKVFKDNIQKIQNNLENIEKEYNNNSHEDKENIIKIIYDKDKNDNIIQNHFNTQSNYRANSISNIPNINKNKKNSLVLKDSSIDYFSGNNLNLRKSINEEKKSIINNLPKINKSFEEIKNLNLSSSTTTNCSVADNNIPKLNLNILTQDINESNYKKIFNNTKTSPNQIKIVNSMENLEKSKKIKNLKKTRKKKENNIVSFLRLFLIGNGNKKLISKRELNYHISKFQEKNSELFHTFRKKKIKFSNLHGFASNLQRVTDSQNFGNLYEKNKYLKKNKYSNLMSNFYELKDESDDMNIKNMDKKISNIYYDLFDFILYPNPNERK